MWLYLPARGNGDGDFFPVGGRLSPNSYLWTRFTPVFR